MSSNSIPKVDLTGLRASLPGGDRWEAAREAVAAALHSHGCFEAVFPSPSTDLREKMFGSAAPELFSLPLESKLRSISDDAYHGYFGQIPHLAFESLIINGVDSPIAVQDFTRLMWPPEGNSTFCNNVTAFAEPLRELVEMVQKMIFQSLRVDQKQQASFASSITHSLRLSEYGVPLNQDTKIALDAHLDPHLLSVICQHKIGGLEIQAMDDGNWIVVPPAPASVTVIAGQSLQAWSNMRVRAPMHRVRMPGKEKRFSVNYSIRPSRNSIVKSPAELGEDDEHPLLYKPFDYTEFVEFIYSEKGMG
ncbi:hypothetical protein KSP40_PGU016779 [Platanthera guangdongensis]|uniref:Fe2OG dioxygenase domain-containing protein n=1 Tax=Platanthera guangdongensis TaxID=2320717 RepID=A0ABR2LVL3_9ASPA